MRKLFINYKTPWWLMKITAEEEIEILKLTRDTLKEVRDYLLNPDDERFKVKMIVCPTCLERTMHLTCLSCGPMFWLCGSCVHTQTTAPYEAYKEAISCD